jgi:hypothetical protein
MEEVAFQTLFRDVFDLVAMRKGYALNIVYRDKLANKEARIGGTQPYHENGVLIIADDGPAGSAGDMDILIQQHLGFPNPNVNDDGPDATEGAIWLLQKLGASMSGPLEFTMPLRSPLDRGRFGRPFSGDGDRLGSRGTYHGQGRWAV